MKIDISHLNALVLLAGIAGAGKSKAIDAIADLGFFNIENLPIALLDDFISLSQSEPSRFPQIVLLPDISSVEKMTDLITHLDNLTPRNKVHLIFLDCANDMIIRRYSETRRPHPSFDSALDKTLEDAILRERSHLLPFRERADLLIDTTTLNIHDLKRVLTIFIESIAKSTEYVLRLNFLSFGFKYGVPPDCDLLIDVRFLPNPYFVESLREHDGTNDAVAQYVLDSTQGKEFLERYSNLLTYLIPQYVHAGKPYLNIGIGCTGGKHRSVAIAEEMARRFTNPSYLISAHHRDKER